MSYTVAEKIRIIAKRQKMTIGALADATGQTRQNLSNKMSRNNFTERDIKEIASALGCTVDIQFHLPDGDTV